VGGGRVGGAGRDRTWKGVSVEFTKLPIFWTLDLVSWEASVLLQSKAKEGK